MLDFIIIVVALLAAFIIFKKIKEKETEKNEYLWLIENQLKSTELGLELLRISEHNYYTHLGQVQMPILGCGEDVCNCFSQAMRIKKEENEKLLCFLYAHMLDIQLWSLRNGFDIDKIEHLKVFLKALKSEKMKQYFKDYGKEILREYGRKKIF